MTPRLEDQVTKRPVDFTTQKQRRFGQTPEPTFLPNETTTTQSYNVVILSTLMTGFNK